MWTPEEQEHWASRIDAATDNGERTAMAQQFADWLESVGRPAHAEVIRLHHKPGWWVGERSPGGWFGWTTPYQLTQIDRNTSGQMTQPALIFQHFPFTLPSGEKAHIGYTAPVHDRRQAERLYKALREESQEESE